MKALVGLRSNIFSKYRIKKVLKGVILCLHLIWSKKPSKTREAKEKIQCDWKKNGSLKSKTKVTSQTLYSFTLLRDYFSKRIETLANNILCWLISDLWFVRKSCVNLGPTSKKKEKRNVTSLQNWCVICVFANELRRAHWSHCFSIASFVSARRRDFEQCLPSPHEVTNLTIGSWCNLTHELFNICMKIIRIIRFFENTCTYRRNRMNFNRYAMN